MNQDSVWQLIRYVLLFAGGVAVSRGWLTDEQLVALIGAIGTIFVVAWGLWVKWDTTPVKDTVIRANAIPVVDGAIGTTKRLAP